MLHRFFIDNWPRKGISLILAVIVWFVVGQSLTTTKAFTNVPVRIVNLPPDMTVEGLLSNGLLNRRYTVVLSGNKAELEDLTSNDFEIQIDATGHEEPWLQEITRENIKGTTHEINISHISKASVKNIYVKLAKLHTEKIPVLITQPIGESPRGYQFLDIWPYQLYITVSGPSDEVKKLKSRGIKLTFNLSDISRSALDNIKSATESSHQDVVSFYVPEHWKTVDLAQISATPQKIDDPDAKYLRIDFVRNELISVKSPVQIDLFIPFSQNAPNPNRLEVTPTSLVESRGGFKIIKKPLYAKGVSELFMEVVKGFLEIQIIMGKKANLEFHDWSVQFINPRLLEDRYVVMLMSDSSDKEMSNLQPKVREEYLRNRFRNYMQRFKLYLSEDQPLELSISLESNKVNVVEENGKK